MSNQDNVLIPRWKRVIMDADAKTIKYWRRNPVIACKEILGIELMDSQKLILQKSWTSTYSVWCCSRNFGKSFLGAIIMILRAVLFENQKIYIISSVGNQAQETFLKIEEIIMQMVNSIESLKDIVEQETVKSMSNKNGFVHDPASFRVKFYNGSFIKTLNSKPSNIRGKRSTFIFFDEAGFCTDELLSVAEAFSTQDSNFKTSTRKGFNPYAKKSEMPNAFVYASSASDVTTTFYRKYKEYAMRMFSGDIRYCCFDIPCDIPIKPHINGKVVPSLLSQSKVDDMMRVNRPKAMREFYNKFDLDGGDSQLVKRSQIVRNETLLLPQLANKGKDKYILAVDPARTTDNSASGVMKLVYDNNVGWTGEIVNCVNFVEAGKQKGNSLMKTPDQVRCFQHMILDYNGKTADYENIDQILIDSGSGGAGISGWADNLVKEWIDDSGKKHKGIIDDKHPEFEGEAEKYNAVDKLKLIDPKKFRNQMISELEELMKLDVIKFTSTYNGKGYIPLEDVSKDGKTKDIKNYQLSIDEEIALINLDAMKDETVLIQKKIADNKNVSYGLPKDKERIMHDDRFYVLCLLAHRLFELRREDNLYIKDDDDDNYDLAKMCFW